MKKHLIMLSLVAASEVFLLLLLTEKVLATPRCLLQLYVALCAGAPIMAFEVEDEPYLVQLCPAQQGGSGSVSADIKVLLTMHCTDDEARTERVHGSGSAGDGGSDFLYDDHPALPGTDDTVCVAYERTVGSAGGAVV